MKCKRVCRLLALMVGGDLSLRKAVRLRKHLETCPACHNQARMYRLSLDKAKECLDSGEVVWRESDWMMSVRTAVHLDRKTKLPLAPWPFKTGWALTAMAAAAAALAFFVVFPSVVKQPKQSASALAVETVKTEILSLKMISQETGLKINWFFHKDLKLEVLE